ncbi:UDP-N-acetylmuramoyl-tripeptide--D-alanyl-D-alanine ligase [Pontiella agarivorans]|uniref:UDP-N-acetylmuramoyl-tripeptide--D-alanyl-D-alanine ligase n=1 Tax=Pontiella agarivorans TaxID=3038953 RepID=A0ABU5MSE7_9BACT|nr:UDP-N-acetylmuramoyl-tripeptide--D-alanyl-D-alanine ligase [Pontiella agarivorans]MDZ8117120.1 UDP-N-acetylmuramoyl-tripeptide--D-alanyl-D-alanine ligase [Pontiella agarivorans]
MRSFRPGELSQWVSRLWKNGMPSQSITGISHDTRKIQSGELYVAIRGAHFDGHEFVQTALDKGAVGALVDDRFQGLENCPLLQVSDTIKGLQDMAAGYRKEWISSTVGITGSVGKTTVKEMCADVLSMDGLTHRTEGNFNNHIGLPLTMLNMPQRARYGVFEIGMNQPGEIGPLTGLLRPKYGIITTIGNAHREAFQSLEDIAHEKMRLAERIPDSGLVFLDRDSRWFSMIRQHTPAEVVTVSFEGEADYTGRRSGERIMTVEGFAYTIPKPGEYMMRNALFAIALGLQLKLSPEEINEGLSRFKAPPMRWEKTIVHGIHFINDAYNANPLSMRASLKTFAQLPGVGRRWAVIGGMRELGAVSGDEHAELGRFVDGLGLDGVITVGELGAQILCDRVPGFFQTLEKAEAAAILKEQLSAGAHVLLKASRGEELEKVIGYFAEMSGPEG